MRSYWTTEENEAYREGRDDESRHRHNYEHEKYSSNSVDEAYFQGRKDVEREEHIRQEEEEMERQQQEAEARREEQRRCEEEDEYNVMLEAQLEQQMEEERIYAEMITQHEVDELATIPSTEEELFMQIEEDERENSITQNMEKKKAHIKVISTALDDHGHYGTTEYKCSECGHDCKGHVKICPNCGVEFNELSTFEGGGYPFGGSDFI
jgi:lipopolysaccharide biosynthesis regulator YciM